MFTDCKFLSYLNQICFCFYIYWIIKTIFTEYDWVLRIYLSTCLTTLQQGTISTVQQTFVEAENWFLNDEYKTLGILSCFSQGLCNKLVDRLLGPQHAANVNDTNKSTVSIAQTHWHFSVLNIYSYMYMSSLTVQEWRFSATRWWYCNIPAEQWSIWVTWHSPIYSHSTVGSGRRSVKIFYLSKSRNTTIYSIKTPAFIISQKK